MGLYDNALPSTYEEIKRFYPSWYSEVKEMDAIWKVQGLELDAIRAALERIISNSYIATADESTIADLERFLGITPGVAQSLEERRQILASSFKGAGSHIGAPEIREITERFTEEGTITISFANGVISVTVEKQYNSVCNYLSCHTVLSNSIPAHLRLDMRVIALLKRESTLYTGFAMKTAKDIRLEMEAVDMTAFVLLTDELGEVLLDTDGTVILDELEVTA